MKDCSHIGTELSAYVDSELAPEKRAEVEKHIAGCPRCQQRVAGLRELAAGVAALPKAQPAPQFLAEVRRKIRGERDTSGQRSWADIVFRPFWVKVPLEALAVVVLLIGASALFLPRSRQARRLPATAMQRESEPAPAPPAETVVATAAQPAREAPAAANGFARMRAAGRDEIAPAPAAPAPAAKAAAEWTVDQRGVIGTNRVEGSMRQHLDFSQTAGSPFVQQAEEVIVVQSDNPGTVHSRVAFMVRPLNGSVTPTSDAGQGVQKFYVLLPPENVAPFKAHFTEAEKLMARRQNVLQLESKAEDRADSMIVPSASVGGATNVVVPLGASGEEPKQSAVLEIQVVPPKR